jgi:cholesterol transport system auxiliary component
VRRAHRPCAGCGAFAAAALLAAGCLAPAAPPDRYWRIEIAPPVRLAAPAFGGRLEVGRFGADSAARGTALHWIAEEGDPEIRMRPYDRWVDSPTLMLQRELASALRAAGIAREVVTPEMGIEPDHRLGGRLARFEEVRGPGAPRVVVELELVVTDARRAELELQATYREEREIAGAAVEDVVRAYDAALSALVARIAADAGARASR